MLEDYLAECKGACDSEIDRLFAPGQHGSSSLYELILDYPRRGGKALRPALSIATCLGLGGHLTAILPTAATLELYHNAFLIHDDIEDESWRRRGQPTLHIDHGIPLARGGPHTYENLRPAHKRCNQRKHAKLMSELIAA